MDNDVFVTMLQAAEQALGMESCIVARSYIRIRKGGQTWLVRPRVVVRRPVRMPPRHHVVPVLSRKGMKALVKAYIRTGVERWPIHADLVLLKPGRFGGGTWLGIYLKKGRSMVVRFADPACRSAMLRMTRAVEQSKLARELGGLSAPKIKMNNLESGGNYVTEEFVDGRLPYGRVEREWAFGAVLTGLAEQYRAYGVRATLWSEFVAETIVGDVHFVAERAGWKSASLRIEELCGHLEDIINVDYGTRVVVSFCHMDLAWAHVALLPRTGEVIVIDWEEAKENPVAVDLARLAEMMHHDADAVVRLVSVCAEMTARCNRGDMIPVLGQLVLGSLTRTHYWREVYESGTNDPTSRVWSALNTAALFIERMRSI